MRICLYSGFKYNNYRTTSSIIPLKTFHAENADKEEKRNWPMNLSIEFCCRQCCMDSTGQWMIIDMCCGSHCLSKTWWDLEIDGLWRRYSVSND